MAVEQGSDESERPQVSVHRPSAERTVFTESGNRDGWIATDLTVDLEQ